MKLIMDEKLKHRLVGICVILSLGAIFFPAMMRKSSQRMEHNFSVKVHLPPKPVVPHVVVTDEEQMFKTIKVAKAKILPSQIPKASGNQKEPVVLTQARTEKLKELAVLNETVQKVVKQSLIVAKPVQTAAITVAKANLATPAISAKEEIKKGLYAVQLASFTQLTNAQALVKKLEQQGYKSNYTKVMGRKGAIYKVFTGYSSNKEEAVKLKTYLASSMQLNGFVVKTGVS